MYNKNMISRWTSNNINNIKSFVLFQNEWAI